MPRCKPRHEKRERYVNSKPRSTNNVAAQHRPPLRATSIRVSVSVRVCAGICAGVCNEPCLLTQFSLYSAAETCRLQACACRWQQWRKMSWKRHIRYVQLQLYYTSASGNYKRVKKRQGKKLLKHVHLLSWPLVATQNNWRKRKYAYNVCPDGLWPIGGSTDPPNE